ncbi:MULTISPECIES: tryptophan 2,3-dioxygenase [unclassified Rhodococcus (in: high G+C Gram-positive bacteria)]|uniref:tryptophan 2,3-dioxygenase n=1 Tax=unclassified Rhodococcus (in: high G+C Gram-positive bacteria) TaxID=192944 RepID=UPI0007BC2E0A|nr:MULTISPECIES: tryptophan 2,3-dioxygenase family protein [unclassified Rhodococcus (in: high G+C Gram-positive bacteria)]KZE98849.1 tryptophan 2,3-dioxygenase [Rhodococcus sp. EPR-279]KZE98920.1 tryptophan 2,3-dioxygenase [Rhodococcus sp. EPR-147]OZE40011.1 tryptophan 2,3-dioxygenase [Rhodococcus sp. 05-2254-4]OZE49579.1 tryptophan 2,3-dioxygenase [Rhodococcus sp. 05-2254-3]OZE50217.1 tryptophan 2,3-dioxygenase [Rhodococcus sp. 05-2254-2]
MSVEGNTRAIEKTVVTDFSDRMSYGAYLDLDTLLSAQKPVSTPEHHDELLFIIQHQTTELWLKLVLHETLAARAALDADDIGTALKCVARVKHIQKTLTEQWSVLATLTPTEYSQFRDFLGNSSGFQSYQYRAVEFVLGNKNAGMLTVFESDPAAYQQLSTLLHQPSLYDAFWQSLARQGYDVPASALDRDVTTAYLFNEDLMPLIKFVYENHTEHWAVYEAFEEFVDLEENFQLWRFRHMRTVLRTIGMKSGTGGSSGVGFLQKALELTFFPELLAVRTEIGR